MKHIKKAIGLSSEAARAVKARLRRRSLSTVCEEARCPNLSECFSRGTLAFMILGNVCTRSCGFCGVKNMQHATLKNPDPNEPIQVAHMAIELGLRHVVITSVTRDDLPDEGALQFVKAITAIRSLNKGITIEVLTPDFHARPDCLEVLCEALPNIYNHNIETVRRLTPLVRSHADYDRSLSILKWVSKHYPKITLKSGIMVGLGEKFEEVVETLRDLCKANCKVITIGQYLSPAKDKLPVIEYVRGEVFEKYKVIGEGLGINYVFSGPFVRSSYMADKTINMEVNYGSQPST